MSAILPSLKIDRDRDIARHFMPHQVNWILAEDALRAKNQQVCALAEKSVRIGWTYADGFKNFRKRLRNKKTDYLFVTKDYQSAIEYVNAAYKVGEIFDYTCSVISHGIESIDVPRIDHNGKETGFTDEVRVGSIKFDNGSRILAFSSNPQALAVYGGDVGLDEFARHPNAQLLWETAQGRVAWNYDLAVWSAHDGDNTLFYRFAQDARAGKKPWNLYYRVTLEDAIDFGLLKIINKVRKTNFTRDQFIANCRNRAGLEEIYQQTYMCNPAPAAASIVDWSAIESCRHPYQFERLHMEASEIDDRFGSFNPYTQSKRELEIIAFLQSRFQRVLSSRAPHRLGFDVAASGQGDLTAIYIDEADGSNLSLQALLTCRTADWQFIETALFFFLKNLRQLQALGDETGLGRQICWKAAGRFPGRFKAVNFSSQKHDIGFLLMNQLALGQKRFPASERDVASDYFALRKNFQGQRWAFTESRNLENPASHCDIAWAGGLASQAHQTRMATVTSYLG